MLKIRLPPAFSSPRIGAISGCSSARSASQVSKNRQIARAIGNPRLSRVVGYALHVNPEPGVIPCHRVVRRDGAVSPAFAFGGSNRQVELLKNEGVGFTDESHVDMARFCVRALPYIAE